MEFNQIKLLYILFFFLFVSCDGGKNRSIKYENASFDTGKYSLKEEKELNEFTKLNLDIVIHVSKSMDGFRFLGSQLGDDIHTFFNNLGDPQNLLVKEITSFTVSTKDTVKIEPLGNGINSVADHIQQSMKVDGVAGHVLKGANKDYSKIFEKVIEKGFSKPNNVSAIVSDLVYYPGEAEVKDLNAYLKGQSQRVRTTIQTALAKHPDLSIILFQGVSDYKWDKRITPNRPYYIIFFGRKSDLQPIMGFAQQNWKGSYFWFENVKKTVTPRILVARGHNWAKGTYETNHRAENLIKSPDLRSGNPEFSFVSEVELSDFKGLEYLIKEGTKYKGGDWVVSKIGIDPKYKSNIKGSFQFEIKTSNKLKPGEFKIRLPYYKPNWISLSSHLKPWGSILESEFEGKTFGFEPLINGMIEAFHIGEKDLLELKFKIEK